MAVGAPTFRTCALCGRLRRKQKRYCDVCRVSRNNMNRKAWERRLRTVKCATCGGEMRVFNYRIRRDIRCRRCVLEGLKAAFACTAPAPGGCPIGPERGRSLCWWHRKRKKQGLPLNVQRPPRPQGVPGRCDICGCREDCPRGCLWADAKRTLCSRCKPWAGGA